MSARLHIFVITFLITVFPVSASAKASIKAKVDRTLIRMGDLIEYTLTVTGDSGSVPEPKIPDFPGFNVSSTSKSSSYSFNNGVFASSKTVRIFLVPRSEGTFKIPPAEIVVGSRRFKSESFTITVKGSGSPPGKKRKTPLTSSPGRGVTPKPRPTQPKRERKRKATGNIFAEMTLDKKRAYVGEQLILNFSFYRRIRLFQQPEYEEPDTTGFWVEELPSPKKEEYRIVGGRQYLVQDIKSALFPIAPGNYTLGSASIRVKTGFFTRAHLLTTEPVNIRVLPLPEKGRPPDFSGAVGRFVMSASLEKKKVAAGKPVTLILTVAGDGNIKTIRQPEIVIPKGIRKYESKTIENITPNFNHVSGEKRYEIILIPQREGKYLVEPVKFSYFNPHTAKYETLASEPLHLVVTPGEETDPQITYTGSRQTEIALLNKDIRFLKPFSGSLENHGDSLFRRSWFWPVQLLPLLTVFFLFIYQRHKESALSDVRTLRLKRAHKMAKKRLQEAEDYRKASDPRNFYGETARALCEYLGDKLNTAVQGMTLDKIEKELNNRGVPPDQIEPVISLLEQSDMARFASHTHSDKEMQQFLNKTEEIIVRLDKLI